MQLPLTREVWAVVFTQAHAELCQQLAARLLAAEMENCPSVPAAEPGLRLTRDPRLEGKGLCPKTAAGRLYPAVHGPH